jgi:hypothetical protein
MKLDIKKNGTVFRVEISYEADDWGVASGAWATDADLDKAISGAVKTLALDRKFATDRDPGEHGNTGIVARRVAVSLDAITELLKDAAAADPSYPVTIDYEDAEGSTTSRAILVNEIERKGWGLDYVIAFDTTKQEPRTFRLDRIMRAEVV